MLYLDEDTQLVKVTNEGMSLKEVKDLWNRDKKTGKSFFKKCITYIYYTYKNRGIFSNYPLKKRQELVVNKYCSSETVKYFEENEQIKKVIELYKGIELTFVENVYEDIKADIYELIDNMRKIPWYLTKQMDVEIGYEVKVEGKKAKQPQTKNVRTAVKINNFAEKVAALDKIDKLLDKEESLRERVDKERILRNVGINDYMYDKRQ
jgi:hypothetical protein